MASGAREIAPSTTHSATAASPRRRRDGPAPSAVWNAGCSSCDKPGSLWGRC
jgi:hypothetical protein